MNAGIIIRKKAQKAQKRYCLKGASKELTISQCRHMNEEEV